VSWFSRVVNIVRRNGVNRDLDEEIQFHLDARTDELVRGGMSADEARREAQRLFGNRLKVRDTSGDIKLSARLESILLDVNFALRLWRRNKTATAAALISLSLAVGACAAAFSLVDALILRSLPVSDPASLVYIAQRAPGDREDGLSFNYPLFNSMRNATRAQVRLFAMSDQRRGPAVFEGSGEPERVYGQWISGDALGILGVKPAIGRLLTASDDVHPGQHPVAVLSHEFWRRRFASDPQVVGRWVTIRDKPLQIVGVAEAGFTGVEPGIMTDLWAPTMMWDDAAIGDASTRWFRIWGRMQPDAAPAQAAAAVQLVFTNFARQLADEPQSYIERLLNTRLYLRSAANGPSSLRRDFARALWLLAGVAGLVLLIACANVACLFVARAATREREMALRLSIGAGRGRLVQQVLIESAVLSIASCLLGALVAIVAAPEVVSMLSTSRSVVRLDLQLDWRLVAFLAAMGSVVTVLFGLAPAVRASGVAPYSAMKAGGRQTAGVGLFRPLIAAQVAFGFVVLFVAGLCLASFVKLARINPGFDQGGLAVARVKQVVPGATPAEVLQGDVTSLAIWEQLLERLQHAPGIESASLSRWGLFEGPGRNKNVRVPGRSADNYAPWYLEVSPGFLKTMRIPLVAGRDFEWRDARVDAPTAVIVNETFARRYFPGQLPVGKRFYRVDGTALAAQDIVGVAADAKYTSIREPAPATVYDAYRPAAEAVVELRTSLETPALTALLRSELPKVHSDLVLLDTTSQTALIGNWLVRDRILALLSAFFSAVAIVLVVVGLYGVLSYSVIQRRRELGIRLALGARPLGVIGLVLSEVGVMAAVGLVTGAAGAFAAARFVTALLYDVSPSDSWAIVLPLACLVLVCALAAVLPALRAIHVDPTSALRCE
jgi:predicted permease